MQVQYVNPSMSGPNEVILQIRSKCLVISNFRRCSSETLQKTPPLLEVNMSNLSKLNGLTTSQRTLLYLYFTISPLAYLYFTISPLPHLYFYLSCLYSNSTSLFRTSSPPLPHLSCLSLVMQRLPSTSYRCRLRREGPGRMKE